MFSRLVCNFRCSEKRRFLRELLLLACAGAAMIMALTAYHLTGPASNLAYDWLRQHQSRQPSAEIVLVTIDNDSLAQLGSWPWSRKRHAEALRRIAAGAPRAVMYDVLFTAPSQGDAVLAQAMSLAPVYLPLLVETGETNPHAGQAQLPVEPLRSAAAGIGHINLETDPDGIVRHIAQFAGNEQRMWPQFTLPVFWAEHGRQALIQPDNSAIPTSPAILDLAPLLRTNRLLIPFSDSDMAYAQVSFVDVLNEKVPAEFFQNKLVLVGATAEVLAARSTTTVFNDNGAMADIEIHANTLDGLLSGHCVEELTFWPTILCSLAPLALLCAGLLRVPPSQSILLLIAVMLATFGTSGALLLHASVWLTPVPALIALGAVYAIWNWRRLKITGRDLEQNILRMQAAEQDVQDLSRFAWDSLNSFPDPVLVADYRGFIRVANQPARDCLIAPGGGELEGCPISEILSTLKFVRSIGSESNAERSMPWPDLLNPSFPRHTGAMEQGVEVQSAAGDQYVLKYAPCINLAGKLIGWTASLSDLTSLHAAQSQRDEMLHFLSHDMRSPQASIIALIELERPELDVPSVHLAFDRIERCARRALALADSVVSLAAAETQEYALDIVNFADILNDAVDEVWSLANAKQIQINCDFAESEYSIEADCSMIARALVNLLSNAIKYSPSNTRIDCLLSITQGLNKQVQCVIRDHGYGIAPEHKDRLFERFHRFRSVRQPDSAGIGLGLAFVKTVVGRHGGTIHCDSEPGRGTTMTIRLPSAVFYSLEFGNTLTIAQHSFALSCER